MKDLVMTRGDTRTFTVALTSADGLALDLTDTDIWFSVEHLFSKRIGAGIAVADPTSGMAVVTVEPSDTSGVSRRTSAAFDVQLKLADGSIRTPIRGRFVIVPDVTIETT